MRYFWIFIAIFMIALLEFTQAKGCGQKKACSKKKGNCQPSEESCSGKIYTGKKYCKLFKTCHCCVEVDCDASTLSPCKQLGGRCIGVNDKCDGCEVPGGSKNFCKDYKTCKCCFPACNPGDDECHPVDEGKCREKGAYCEKLDEKCREGYLGVPKECISRDGECQCCKPKQADDECHPVDEVKCREKGAYCEKLDEKCREGYLGVPKECISRDGECQCCKPKQADECEVDGIIYGNGELVKSIPKECLNKHCINGKIVDEHIFHNMTGCCLDADDQMKENGAVDSDGCAEKICTDSDWVINPNAINSTCKKCNARNDPHFNDFSGEPFDWQRECNYALVQEGTTMDPKFGIFMDFKLSGTIAYVGGPTTYQEDLNTKVVLTPGSFELSVNGLVQQVNSNTPSRLVGPNGMTTVYAWKHGSCARLYGKHNILVELCSNQITMWAPIWSPGKPKLAGLCGSTERSALEEKKLVARNGDKYTPSGGLFESWSPDAPDAFGLSWQAEEQTKENCPIVERRSESAAINIRKKCLKDNNDLNKEDCQQVVDNAGLTGDDIENLFNTCLFDLCIADNDPETPFTRDDMLKQNSEIAAQWKIQFDNTIEFPVRGCDPQECSYKDLKGRCSREVIRGSDPVGEQQCTKGCECYIQHHIVPDCGPACLGAKPSRCMCMDNNKPCPDGYCNYKIGRCENNNCSCCKDEPKTECESLLKQCSAPGDYCAENLKGECPKGFVKLKNACYKKFTGIELSHEKDSSSNRILANDCDCCKNLGCTSNGDACTGKGSYCIEPTGSCPAKTHETTTDCSKPVLVNGVHIASQRCKCCKPRNIITRGKLQEVMANLG